MNTPAKSENRFEEDAGRYAAFLETPEGRLRADLTFANLQDALPASSGTQSLHALDLGCGTGATAIRLARLGMQVTLLDSSPSMLELAERTLAASGVHERVTLKCGDAAEIAETFPAQCFDLILCHNVLEFVEHPETLLRSIARLMSSSSAILSLLVRNQAGEVLKAALRAGDLAAAENNLSAEWGQESLYQGRVRFFTPEGLEAMLAESSLKITARRGVRVLSDYLPPKISLSTDYERIFDLEHKLSKRSEFFGMARYLQYLVCSEAAGSGRGI
jgi:S-adenosylmethionine-dependent methyltransferase